MPTTFAQSKPSTENQKEVKKGVTDTLKNPVELNLTEQDSILNDSLKKKSFLQGNVVYSAKNYMRLNRRNNKMYLYDDAKIKYTDMDIESGSIIIHQSKKEVYAKGIVDTADAYTQTPIFTQGQNVVEPDTIRFNFDTKKALIYNSKTSQSGFNIINEVSKRENDSVVYMKNVRFTTSKNLDDPEYYFYARRIKFVPKKKIVSGLVNMYIADVPTPLGLPFGYFPMKEEAVSGFIIPSFNDSNDRGFTLQNGGYYFAISDYMNLTLVGDYSTNNSFAIRADSDYAKRYRFTGNVSIRYENNITSERGFSDFSKATNYNIRWSHTQSQKASPNSRFSANVNFGSSQFFRQSRNLTNVASSLNTELNTGISYSRTIPTNPQINFDTALRIRQNTSDQSINITTPININVARIYPLAPKVGSKKGILQNINLQLTTQAESRINTDDDNFLKSQMFRDADIGVRHNIPLSTNFKILKHLSASASTTFTESWVFETIQQSYQPNDPRSNQNTGVLNDTIKGFDSFRTYNFSTSLGTTIYGTKEFKKDAKIKAIRHVVRPNISYSYGPSFDQFYEEYIIPADATLNREQRIVEYSRFAGGFYSPPGNRESSSMSFSINNVLEAKVTDRDTTKLEAKKIKILNSLNFSSGYDFRADSLNLRPISVRGSIPVVKKLTLNFGGTLDPYALNSNNRRINRWNIDNGGSLLRLTNANLNFGYSFSSNDFKNKKEKEPDPNDINNETFRNGGRPDDLFGTHTDFRDGSLFEDETDEEKAEKTDVAFYNYKMPWSLRLSYSVNYSNNARQDQISSQSLSFSGDIELAPRWKVGASSGYDIVNKGFTFTNLRFQRDLESWRMSFNWVPFSTITSWNFYIGISSSVLSDIKWDKRRQPDRR
ncbi:putative LPS assembly protein LptD [Aquimarina agarilytica]|uniref:putative LPS assembly protein LptD n=1 Tax=Aquimarina agarilytica TaxID=1087449 RepID=UPI000288C209|nr:putative LPS assembly protein LptD [Aquimarina agarilytica]